MCPQLLASVGIILNGANVVGYVKCRRDAGSRLSSMATQFIGKKVLEQVKRVSKYMRVCAVLTVHLPLSPGACRQCHKDRKAETSVHKTTPFVPLAILAWPHPLYNTSDRPVWHTHTQCIAHCKYLIIKSKLTVPRNKYCTWAKNSRPSGGSVSG